MAENELEKRVAELKGNLGYLKQETIKNVVESGLTLYKTISEGGDINGLYLLPQIKMLFVNSIDWPREMNKTNNLLSLLDKNKEGIFRSTITKLRDTFKNEPNKNKFTATVSDLIYEIFLNLIQKQTEKCQSCTDEIAYMFSEIENVKFNPRLGSTTFFNKFEGSKTLDLLNQFTNEDKKTVIGLLKGLLQKGNKKPNGYFQHQNYQYPIPDFSNENTMLINYFEGYLRNNSRKVPERLKSFEKDILSVVDAMAVVIQKRINTEKLIKDDLFILTKEFVNNKERLLNFESDEIYDQLEASVKRNAIIDLKIMIEDHKRRIEVIILNNESIGKQIKNIQNRLSELNELLKEDGYYAKEEKKIKDEIASFREQIELKDQVKVQNIAIPFESWFFEVEHKVIIYLSENPKKKIIIQIPLRQSMKNGQTISYGKMVLRLNFTHPHFRREGNDVIYYLHDKEINRDYRNSAKPPSKPIVNYTYNEFHNNEIIVPGGGFKDGNGFGRFIIRKIDNNQEIPLKENVLVQERLEDEMKYKVIKQKLVKLLNDREGAVFEKKKLEGQIILLGNQISDNLNEIKQLELLIEGLTIKIIEIEKRIEEEKINGTYALQKKIIETAIEEKRIIQADPIPQSRKIEFVEEKDGCFIVKFGNENLIVSPNGKNNLIRIDIGCFGRRTMYYKKIGEYPIDDVFKYNQLINGVLKKDNSVLIFDVNIPNSYNKPIYPVVPCFRNAFGLKGNGPMIFPINIGKSANRHVFVNGYFTDNKEDGIIIINTKFVDDSEIQMVDDDFDLSSIEEEKQSPKPEVSCDKQINLNESSSAETKMDCEENEKSDTEKVEVESLEEEREEDKNPKHWECTQIKEGNEEIFVCKKGEKTIALRMVEKIGGGFSDYNSFATYQLRSFTKDAFKTIYKENKGIKKEFPLVLPKDFEKKEGKFIGLELGIREEFGLSTKSHLPLIVRIPLNRIENKCLHIFEIEEGIFVSVRIIRE